LLQGWGAEKRRAGGQLPKPCDRAAEREVV